MHIIRGGGGGEGEGKGRPTRPLNRVGVSDLGLAVAVVFTPAARPWAIRLRCFPTSKSPKCLCRRRVGWFLAAFNGKALEFESTPAAATFAKQHVIRHSQIAVRVVNSPPPVLWGYDPALEALSNAAL